MFEQTYNKHLNKSDVSTRKETCECGRILIDMNIDLWSWLRGYVEKLYYLDMLHPLEKKYEYGKILIDGKILIENTHRYDKWRMKQSKWLCWKAVLSWHAVSSWKVVTYEDSCDLWRQLWPMKMCCMTYEDVLYYLDVWRRLSCYLDMLYSYLVFLFILIYSYLED